MALVHSPKIVTDNLIFCLDAANLKSYGGSGTTVTDLSSSGNNATLDGATHISGTPDYFEFGGDDDHIDLSSGMFNCNSNFTFSCWVNSDANDNFNRTIISSPSSGALQIRLETGDEVQIVDSYVTNVGTFSGFTASSSTWYNIVVARNSNTYSLYVDGKYISNFTSSNTYSTNPNRIGINQDDSEDWDGKISFISCYDIVLTAAEIKQNYNAHKGRFGL